MTQPVRNLAAKLLGPLLFVTLVLGSGAALHAATKAQAPARGSANYSAWLQREVRHRLIMLPWYTVFDNLSFKVEGNNVTLYGQVVRPDLKDDAARTVKGIEGVGKVDNQIQTLPTSNMDDRLRRAEFRAIYSYPALQLYGMEAVPSIHIIVNNGHVTLVGVVDNENDKNVAALRANTVPGVFSVKNELVVQNNKKSGAKKSS
ncbi:MAG TPA: BON domain-containing protein [Candidatus Acidoferrales bacterium]|nr:BON domain-containing protein [Candidatus Acidoferrales bacterium]